MQVILRSKRVRIPVKIRIEIAKSIVTAVFLINEQLVHFIGALCPCTIICYNLLFLVTLT